MNIVGHSLGGWQAAHLAQQLNEVRCGAVDNLITLDPVGTRYRIKPFGGIKLAYPKPTAKTWTNIRAESEGVSVNDTIADLGGQWDPSMQNPTYNYILPLDHAFANSMLTNKIQNGGSELGESPWDLLIKHYQNLPTNYNFENAPASKP